MKRVGSHGIIQSLVINLCLQEDVLMQISSQVLTLGVGAQTGRGPHDSLDSFSYFAKFVSRSKE